MWIDFILRLALVGLLAAFLFGGLILFVNYTFVLLGKWIYA